MDDYTHDLDLDQIDGQIHSLKMLPPSAYDFISMITTILSSFLAIDMTTDNSQPHGFSFESSDELMEWNDTILYSSYESLNTSSVSSYDYEAMQIVNMDI